jgi:hypothetical protein
MVKQLSPNIYKTFLYVANLSPKIQNNFRIRFSCINCFLKPYLINDYAFIGKAINFMVFPTVGSMTILKIRMRKSEAVK